MIVMIKDDKFNQSTEGRKIDIYIVYTGDITDTDVKIWIESLLTDVVASGDEYNDEIEVHPMYESLNNVKWYRIDRSDIIEAPFKIDRVITIMK